MKDSKLRIEQEAPMDVYPVRMTAKHARMARKLGEGNLSQGMRVALETQIAGYVDRRGTKADRRKKPR